MTDFNTLKILDYDHLEVAVADLERAAELYLRMGFERVGTREIRERKLHSLLMVQNGVSILLSHSALSTDPVAAFVAAHGDGVFNIAFRCEDAVSALEIASNRGAEVADPPRLYKRDFGIVTQASIKAFGDVRHTFISREGSLFAEGFEVAAKSNNRGTGLQRVDHITCYVERGQLRSWCEYYERVFGLRSTSHFDLRTTPTAPLAKVMQSPTGNIRLPVNEPPEGASNVQEFIDINHGPGVQHVAFATGSLVESVRQLRRAGLPFISAPPAAYFAAVPERVPGVQQNLGELAELGILVDGDANGYLLQAFTEGLLGPFSLELIQRCGGTGFGEGNVAALQEASEREQIQRGVLT